MDFEMRPALVGLAQNFELEYMGTFTRDGEEVRFIVICPRAADGYYGYRLQIGPTLSEEVPITNITRYRDGGTTLLDTKLGKFYFPGPFNEPPDNQPLLDESPICVFAPLRVR